MNQIVVNNLSLDIHEGPIGVSCSGGADSSLLLYILMKYAPGPIHVFTCSLDSKNRSSIKSSTEVLNKCINLTGNYNVYHHTHFVREGKTLEELFANQLMFLEKKIINILYTAITSNPPYDIQLKFKEQSFENAFRHPNVIRDVYQYDNKIYTPFTNINKQEIAKMYKELDILDTLFPVTRSCESFTLTEGHCGHCWWCEERHWAFEKL